MEVINKKILTKTIIGISFLLLIVIGATYAYFTFSANNEFESQNISGSLEQAGNVILKSVENSLVLDLSATDMLIDKAGTYYASGSETPATLGEFTVAEDGEYECTYTLEVTKSSTEEDTDLYTKFQNMSTKSEGQVYLEINNTVYDFNISDLFTNGKITYTGKIVGLSNTTNKYINANLIIVNSDSIDQTGINNANIKLEFDVTELECGNYTPAYAIYSEDDTSLRFYKNNDEVSVGDTYNNLTVTALYSDIEQEYNYEYNVTDEIPWHEYSEAITTVVVEEEIEPTSTEGWFTQLVNATSLDVTNINTNKLRDMSYMFRGTGFNITSDFEIKGMDNWNVSNVNTMEGTFWSTGVYATGWTIGDLSSWNTENVTTMKSLFTYAGSRVMGSWSVGDISNWKTSKVTNMEATFGAIGYENTTEVILDLSGWDTGNVTNMADMFWDSGHKNATTFELDLSGWDTSKVTNMSYMFWNAGQNATTWSVGDITRKEVTVNEKTYIQWDTSNVTNMSNMFINAGLKADYTLDLTSWQVPLVTSYSSFNTGVTDKITPPVWVN